MAGQEFIQYGKQTIEEEDIEAIVEVFRENQYLTTGPRVAEFEHQVCALVGAKYGVAVNSGTAGLHCAIRAIDLRVGEQVIVPAISFAATANCVLYEQGIPVFCDVEPGTLNLDPAKLEELVVAGKTRAVIMVDYAGQVPDYHRIRSICTKYDLVLIEDSAHSIGHRIRIDGCLGGYVGSFADLTTFSFHPVKNMTTGEGGMIVTNNLEWAQRMRQFRTHGITTEYQNRKMYEYDITQLGFNYRLTDFQSALGISQLRRVEAWIERRNQIADRYLEAFGCWGEDQRLFWPLENKYGSAYHIFLVLLQLEKLDCDRDQIFAELKEQEQIGVNVHYKPIYLLSLYQQLDQVEASPGLCPVAEDAYARMLTLPLFPSMTDQQVERVIESVNRVVEGHRKT